jgi:hypothetical protein
MKSVACCSDLLRGCWSGSVCGVCGVCGACGVCGVCGVLNLCCVELEGAVLGDFEIDLRTLKMLLYENIVANCLDLRDCALSKLDCSESTG